jgi:adenylate kinase
MTGRLLKRGETSGRADDNVETIKKRLDTFHQHSEPVMDAYASKCAKIPAERAVDDIFADVCSALDKL